MFKNQLNRTLVVDNNEYNRDMLSKWLKRQGHEIVLAVNGLAALEALQNNEIDLMLLDVMMPEMNGIQVLEHIYKSPGGRNNLYERSTGCFSTCL